MGKGLLKKTIVTKGENGCDYRDINYPAPGKLQTIDVSGAGDTFLAALAVKWLETGNIKKPFHLQTNALTKLYNCFTIVVLM